MAVLYAFDGHKNRIAFVGDIPIPPTAPMVLPDGSILFYDRGSQYGEYHIDDTGYPIRNNDAVDDSSAESQNWRYLICDKSDLDNTGKQWGPYGTNEGMTNVKYQDMGYGLPNTDAMIAKYADNDSYWWKLIKEKRDSTGFKWFMPSKDELDIIYDNRTAITGQGGNAFKTDTPYWASTEERANNAYAQYLSKDARGSDFKNLLRHCRLLRRI